MISTGIASMQCSAVGDIDTTVAERQGRPHILAVDDVPVLREVVRGLFEDEGYTVTACPYGPALFEEIAALQPTVLLLDVVEGHAAGWRLLERLQADARTDATPVIVLSTSPCLLQRAWTAFSRPGWLFLAKPVNLDDLVAGVRALARITHNA